MILQLISTGLALAAQVFFILFCKRIAENTKGKKAVEAANNAMTWLVASVVGYLAFAIFGIVAGMGLSATGANGSAAAGGLGILMLLLMLLLLVVSVVAFVMQLIMIRTVINRIR